MTMPSNELDAWVYDLPDDRIARYPLPQRDASRMLRVPIQCEEEPWSDGTVSDLPGLLRAGDVLVLNDTRVMAARLDGRRATGGSFEVLALEPGPGPVPCMIRNARRLKVGESVMIEDRPATILERLPDGLFSVDIPDLSALMEARGRLPLPPYFRREADEVDQERYQTVFAGPLGAAAAPTAGLHFTDELLDRIRSLGVEIVTVTLHVGIGTFRPLRIEDVERGELHPEGWSIPDATEQAIRRARDVGGRVIAVGTTSTRALEAATLEGERIPRAGHGTTRLFIQPGRSFRTVDGLLTNFHLPKSSLLMLVAAFIGRDRLLAAYDHAVDQGYRFYSYGDAMLLLP